jgi:uncharacterized RDD family membrane protein YckC
MECPHCHRQTSQLSKSCGSCGLLIPPAQYLLEESGVIDSETGAANADVRVARGAEQDPDSYRMASLGDRFIAFALDTLALFGVFTVVDAWVFMRWGTVDGTELKLTSASLLIAGILNAVILFTYGWLLETGFGATLGKAMVGIRVVRTTHRNPFAALAIRNALRIVDGLGFYLVGVLVASCSNLRQRLGDICADTAVVEEEFGYPVKILAMVLWVGTLAGAGWAVPRICSENNAVQHKYLNHVLVQVGRAGDSAYFRVVGLRIDVQMGAAE